MCELLDSLSKNLEKMNSDMTVTSTYLLSNLKTLFEYSMDLATKRQTRSNKKPQWARIAVQAAGVMASILKDVELEGLRDEIEALKR